MCRWLSLMSFWHCWVPASGRSSNLWSAQARGAQVTCGGVPGDRHFISPPGIPVWHHSINNGAINYDLLDWWIRLDRKEECSCVIILHWDTLMTSWRAGCAGRGWREEFIYASLEWHTVSDLIILVINGVIDMIMIPYPNMLILHSGNTRIYTARL